MKYAKPALLIADQVQLLQSRGLQIPDVDKAFHYLSNISYYRLRAYTFPFQQNKLTGHPFLPGTTFDQVLDLYIFDRELRLLTFDAIERVEIALRTQIIHRFAMTHGSHWHEVPAMYNDTNLYVKDMNSLGKEVGRSAEVFIKHYKSKYTSPTNPPAWMALEVTSLGLLSKIFENLKICPEKKAVAVHFGLSHPFVLESWMHSFSQIRNICAHHGRLWNRILTKPPMLPKKPLHIWLLTAPPQVHKLYPVISALQYVLNIVSPGHHWRNRLFKLFDQYPAINPTDLGFPPHWQNEPLWKA